MFQESTQIIKQHGKNCFVDIRAAYLIGEGKVEFNFRTLDPKTNKVQGKIDCYLSIEEFHFLAHLLKTGSIFSYLQSQPAHRYVSYGGRRDGNEIIARQLRIEGDAGGLFLKGMQGPGKTTATGGYTLACKDNEAFTITVRLDAWQAQMMGLAFQRAVDYYDEWNRSGTLQARMEALRHPVQKPQMASVRNQPVQSFPQPAQSFSQPVQSFPQEAYF